MKIYERAIAKLMSKVMVLGFERNKYQKYIDTNTVPFGLDKGMVESVIDGTTRDIELYDYIKTCVEYYEDVNNKSQ